MKSLIPTVPTKHIMICCQVSTFVFILSGFLTGCASTPSSSKKENFNNNYDNSVNSAILEEQNEELNPYGSGDILGDQDGELNIYDAP